MRKRLIPVLLSMLAGACSVGPNFTPPEAKAPDNWNDLQRAQNPPDDVRFPHASVPSRWRTPMPRP